MIKQTKLETKRLILRPLLKKDATSITKYLQNPIFPKTLFDITHPYTIKNALKYIQQVRQNKKRNHPTITYAIFSKDLEEVIGIISCGPIKNKRCHTGSWIGKPLWHTGLMIEARLEILKWLFNDLNLNKVCCEIIEDNKRSQKHITKFGFKKQGVFQKNVKINNRWQDQYYYELLAEQFDYNKLKKKLLN